jgi:hypothetical protein
VRLAAAVLGLLLAGALAADPPPDGGQDQAPAPATVFAPRLWARVHVFQADCSYVSRPDVLDAIAQASDLLGRRCGVGLKVASWTRMDLPSPWCQLPPEKSQRKSLVAYLARIAKRRDPRSLAFFLLPSKADQRFSWALVDISRQRGCGSPSEARFLDRFGSAFFTDLAWKYGGDSDAGGEGGTSGAAILVAHETLHCLTQRGHPTYAPRGAVMADSLTDMGDDIDADWCACARQSPYLSPAP